MFSQLTNLHSPPSLSGAFLSSGSKRFVNALPFHIRLLAAYRRSIMMTISILHGPLQANNYKKKEKKKRRPGGSEYIGLRYSYRYLVNPLWTRMPNDDYYRYSMEFYSLLFYPALEAAGSFSIWLHIGVRSFRYTGALVWGEERLKIRGLCVGLYGGSNP